MWPIKSLASNSLCSRGSRLASLKSWPHPVGLWCSCASPVPSLDLSLTDGSLRAPARADHPRLPAASPCSLFWASNCPLSSSWHLLPLPPSSADSRSPQRAVPPPGKPSLPSLPAQVSSLRTLSQWSVYWELLLSPALPEPSAGPDASEFLGVNSLLNGWTIGIRSSESFPGLSFLVFISEIQKLWGFHFLKGRGGTRM